MKRVIAYVRCSTEKNQDNGERQIQQIKTFCINNGLEFLEEETIRENISGAIVVRSGLSELLSLSKADCDIVVVSETSRLTRSDDVTDLLIIVKKIQSLGLDLIVLGSNDNKIYPADKKLSDIQAITLIIEASANARERLTIQERLKTGKEKKAKLGGFTGHKVSYGYKIEPNLGEGKESEKVKGFYAINEDEAKIVKIMFDLVANNGYSLGQVSKHLTGITGQPFFTAVTSRRIKNPVYKGELAIHGTIIAVPPIISEEVFNKAQQRVKENHLHLNKGNKNYNQLKGIAKCACGSSMYLNVNGRNKEVKARYLFYRCTTKNSGSIAQPCSNFGISAEFLNNIVWSVVKSYINVEDFKAKTEQSRKNIEIEIKGKQRQLNLLEKEKSDLESKATNTTNLLISTINLNIIPNLEKALSEVVEKTEVVNGKIIQLNKDIKKLGIKIADLTASLLTNIIQNSSEEGKHEVFKKYIQQVVYYSVSMNKGIVVITFTNGLETIILTKTRPDFEAFIIPSKLTNAHLFRIENISLEPIRTDNLDKLDKLFTLNTTLPEFRIKLAFSFNRENRKIVELLPDRTKVEYSYSDFCNTYDVEKFKMQQQ